MSSVNYFTTQKIRFFALIIVAISILFANGCSNRSASDKQAAKKAAFRKFLSKFDVLSLPLEMKPGRMQMDHYKKLDSADNAFTGYMEKSETLYAYGLLPDTSGSFKVIWFEPADDYYPVLATFTKNGKKIKQEDIGVGGCGEDCGFSCTETIDISKKMTIFSVDSVTENDCDTSGNETGKTEKYTRYKTGQITKGGRIHLSKTQQKSF